MDFHCFFFVIQVRSPITKGLPKELYTKRRPFMPISFLHPSSIDHKMLVLLRMDFQQDLCFQGWACLSFVKLVLLVVELVLTLSFLS